MIGQDDEVSEDEDVKGFVERRMSMNQYNMAGMNFQKYQESKPSAGVRREILNMFNEYKEFEDKNHAREELIAICKQYEIQTHCFLGYFLNNSLAEKPDDFRQYMALVFEYFFEEKAMLDTKQMLESVNICVANLPDLIVDYPNAKLYANEIINKGLSYKVLTDEEAEKYK